MWFMQPVVIQGLVGYIVAEKNGQLLVCSLKGSRGLRNLGNVL